MNVFQIYIGCISTIAASFDCNLIAKVCYSTEIFILECNGIINFYCYFFICCPLNMNFCLHIFSRSRHSAFRIPWISWCTILLPEPSTVIISDKHSRSICIVSKIQSKTITVCCTGIGIWCFHCKIHISCFWKIKGIWINKHCRFGAWIISISNTWSQMQPFVLYCTNCIIPNFILQCPFIIDTIFQLRLNCNLILILIRCFHILISLCCFCCNRIQTCRNHCSDHWCRHCKAKHPDYNFFPHTFSPPAWSP